MSKAIEVLSKIYDHARLDDELEYIATQAEEEKKNKQEVSYKEVFRRKEIRLAFFAGAGLQVTSIFKNSCGMSFSFLSKSQ